MDGEGFLYLTDRKKDMIISGGENIASSEVERVIYQLPQIREVAVVGLPDDRWGERPVAVVVLSSSQTFDPKAVIEHCRRHLGAFKVPSEVVVCDTLPETRQARS
jgi:fatty-acyl-CoA synthase